jgi:hypothetical protein
VSYELTITNRGDGVARNVRVADNFDLGLSHEGDLKNTRNVEKPIRDLAPNDSERVALTFKLVEGGRQCHRVTVTADGVADPVKLEGCVTALQATIEVKITGAHRRVVGEIAEFNAAVKNTGSSGATNVVLRVLFDQAIEPVIESGVTRLDDGSISVQMDRELAPNERRVIPLRGRCRNPSSHACAKASVTALGGAVSQDEACLEILPALPTSPPPGP